MDPAVCQKGVGVDLLPSADQVTMVETVERFLEWEVLGSHLHERIATPVLT